ncbi:MAG: SLC13 family permease [Myxococcota bacterium]
MPFEPIGVAIFALTYALVSARRIWWLGLDRAAAALLGAVLCVTLRVLPPRDAIAAVDADTLLLLFGVMGMGAFLVLDRFFDVAEARLAALAGRPALLLGAVVWGSGALAALVTNDAVCVLGAPLVVRLIRRCELPPVPFLLALATGANTGSVATLVGNPQNMLCGQLGGLAYGPYLLRMAPVAVAGLAVTQGVLWLAYRARLVARPAPAEAPVPLARSHLVTLGVIAATAAAYTLGAPLSWTAVAGVVALLLLHRRDAQEVWRHVDWSLLLFFAGLFVVVAGLVHTGAVDAAFARFPLAPLERSPLRLAGVFLVGSNVVSNVPFILVVREQMHGLADPRAAWTLLAMASTFAGNLTLLGSAANVIVAEAGREVGSFGFWEHLRVGAPIALVTTLLGTLWLAAVP